MFITVQNAFARSVSTATNPHSSSRIHETPLSAGSARAQGRLRKLLLVSAAIAFVVGLGTAAPAAAHCGHCHKVADSASCPATFTDNDHSPTRVNRLASVLPEVTLVSVSPASPRVGEVLTITVRMDPPILAGAPNITGGVLIRDPGICGGVNLNAFVFRPGQAEATAAHYWIYDDVGYMADRRIRVTLNPAFDDFYNIGQPSSMTVVVQSQYAAGKVALPEPPTGDFVGANHPNPFNSATWIPYRLGTAGDVHLDIYNLLGQRVRTLVDGAQAAGTYRIRWNGLSQAGEEVASGTYIARLRHGGAVQFRRLLYVR